MATVHNPWLRGVTGKVAGMVVQGGTTRGATIIRERVVPSDPKTVAQRVQRVIMSTVGVAYSKMAGITDHAFEGFSGKAANMNRFRSLNANMLRQYVATEDAAGKQWAAIFDFTPKGTQWLGINGWIMSEGSLPRIPFVYGQGVIEIPTGMKVADWAIGDKISYSDLMSGGATGKGALSALGMKAGDQITVCGICHGKREQVGSTEKGVLRPSFFSFCRFILAGANSMNDVVFTLTGEDQTVTDAELNTEKLHRFTQLNGWQVSLSVKEGQFYLMFTSPNNTEQWVDDGLGAATAILSRKVNGKWLRSPSTMAFTRSKDVEFEEGWSFPLSYAISDAISNINTENDRYLNNAQQEG